MNKISFTDTTLRDGPQSLWATRMSIEDMLPIIEKIDNAGYASVEVWGGATFDVCMRYLGEDPWERLRTFKKCFKKTPLQMLLRGQTLVGYQQSPDDVVEAFVTRAIENGIDIMRIFDALNSIDNMKVAIRAAKKAGGKVQGSVCYTISPVHTMEHFLRVAQQLVDEGVDSLCLKDMGGILTPQPTYDIIKMWKEHFPNVPVQLHTHFTCAMAPACALEAARAGAEIIDTCSAPLAFGSSQPPIEPLVRSLEECGFTTDMNEDLLWEIADYFEDLRAKYGYERGVNKLSDMKVFTHQVPGGMISNLVSQLRQQKAEHRLNEVLAEVPNVRADLGYPPLVTPCSQIVGIQSVLNVLTGQRYKLVPDEVKAYVKGLYGPSPAPINEDVKKKIIGDEKPISCRPADLLTPKMEEAKKEIADLTNDYDQIIAYAMFPMVTRQWLEGMRDGTYKIDLSLPSAQAALNNEEGDMDMNLKDIKELISALDSKEINEFVFEDDKYKLAIRKGVVAAGAAAPAAAPVAAAPAAAAPAAAPAPVAAPAGEVALAANQKTIVSPIVGTFYAAPAPDAAPFVKVGDVVAKGQTVCIVEAMKLFNQIESDFAGKIVKVLVENAEAVEYGQPLFIIEE